MLMLNDWILLKAIFNQRLHNAVLEMNEERILNLINDEYKYEKDNGFIGEEPIDMDRVFKEHNENINNEELINRLV
ncbi:hypothetical protein [Paenibacillus sp. Y412MC10]|uniref:hypothetical protein n=1 Tax=Geobacillus sp. (strain Y412MC10) TaxID=481743 RepID=UPI0011A1BBEA|nr:hypothetical protein [Paenibacillus sp. Y412MC10]